QAAAEQGGAGQGGAPQAAEARVHQAADGKEPQGHPQQDQQNTAHVAKQQPQQGQLAAPGEAVDDPAGEGDGRQIAAENPQGGTVRQAQHRGQGKARHQQQGGAGAAGEGRQAR